ncbi:hypothetical protein NM688_g6894 [Phlebia brevispora]|uniref:Uncharacterized protein n=1 Tax=Phlebia brevispora TaxID=194682 RepID=A0ACC1SBB6_9APHY|nr:hypothetical protein NM688_g6894 [Phlebia brevispora]
MIVGVFVPFFRAPVQATRLVPIRSTNFLQGQWCLLVAITQDALSQTVLTTLDEAVSSIGFAANAKIQATSREESDDSTVLTSTAAPFQLSSPRSLGPPTVPRMEIRACATPHDRTEKRSGALFAVRRLDAGKSPLTSVIYRELRYRDGLLLSSPGPRTGKGLSVLSFSFTVST